MQWMTPRLWALVWALAYAAQADAKLVRSYNHVNSICSMWGRDHFKTFDGDVYQFPGMCEYNLASDCHSSFQDFSIHIKKRVDDKGQITVSRIMVTIKELPIQLTKQLIMVGGEIVSTPYHVSGVLIEENSAYTKLHYKLGLSVMWNREDAVMVELDPKYANRTCGLCGDYNGVPVYDEFISQGRKIGVIEFGNKQKIHNPNVDCEDPYEEEEDDEEQQQQQQQEVDSCLGPRSSCAQRLLSPAWASCASRLDPSPYISACAMDLCHPSPPANESSMCATLAEYSRQCSHARGTPPNWRTPTFCAMKCPYNMVYLESGSPCMNTCTHMETNSLCEEHNMDGCFCPEGTVFDDLSKSGCIPKEQCQCKHDRIYNNGEVLKMDTEECVCHEGRWSCKSHAGPGACAVEEGSHVTTYDGKTYNFHGNCFYVLSKDCVGSKFSILGELAPCSSQDWDTCLKRVVFRLLSDKRNDIVIQANGKVYHNAEVNLPYSTGDLTIFKPSSFHIILQTHFGLQLQIQLVPIMQLYISLDPSFRTKTCGLCGNYNMKLSDDLRSPQGMVEGTASSFANSWKAKTTCADSPDRLDDPCSISVDNENFAEHWCSLLKDKEAAFSKCHKAVNPDIYYKRCKYASCTCDRSEECLCAVVSSYVRACSTKGVFLPGWRDTVCKKYTDHCPATQTFSYQLQGCQRTCRSLGSDRQACSPDFLPVDGCSCPDGLYLDDSGVCVPMNKCPCQHNGDYIKPGKSINIKDEHCVCTNGKLHCRSWKRMPKGCPAPKVFFNCSAVDNNDAEMECVRTCMQRNVDCIAMECESGCRCPAGLLDDGRGHCVEEHNCPCHHDGHFYSSGAQIPLKCNNCTCNSGQWICSDKTCSSTCTIYGSGHYQTFDDQRFGFNGECSYVAVQDKCGDTPGSFNVITENVPCGTTGTTCSKSVRIVLGRTEVKLSDGAYEEIDLGGTGPPIKYTVRNVGLYLVIESVIGLTAFWDRRTTVRVILQPELMGKVCGLCGNFNGDGKDDFTTQGQLLVSDVLEFANSWKVSTCPDAEDNFDPCFKTPNRHTWAKMQCGIINSDTFKNCHPKVNPNPFFENCVKDSCACDNGGDCECFCTAVAAYAQACNEAGVCVAWRTPDICPVYCDYYNGPLNCTWHYSPCHTPCYKTCLNPEGICSAPIPNLEGCYPICPEDKPIFDEEKQICVEECEGCIINDHVYKPGEEVPTDKLCNSCICNQNGNLTCNRIPGCCVYNGTEYEENEVIYNVTDKMGMCYYAICINQTVIHESKPCIPTPSPPTPTQTTAPPEPTSTTGKTTVVSPTPGTPSTPSPTPTETTGPTTPGTSPTTPASGTPPLISTPTPTKPPGTPSTTEKTTVVTLTSGTWPTSIPSEPPMQSTTITTPRTEPTTCAPLCEWTEWFDVDTPHEIVDDDDETYENIKENGKTICDKPEDIRCRAVGYEDSTFEEFISVTSQDVQCNVSFGLLCEQHKQTRPPKKCYDYEIQVYCCTPCIHPPTPTTVSSEKTTVSSPPPSSTLTSTTGRPISTTTMYTPRTVSTTVEPTVTTAATSAGSSATETPVVTTMFTVRTESTLSPHFTSAPQEVFTTSTVTNPETSTTTGPPKPTPPIGTPEVSPTTGRTTVVSPTPETAPPPSPSTTTGPPKPTPPIGTPEVSPTTGRTTAPPPSPSTTTTTGPPKPTPPIGTPEASPTTGRTTVVSPTPETAPPPSPSTTTTTGPPKPTPPIGTPEASPTTGRTTAPLPSPSTTTTTGPPKPTPTIGTPEASPTTGRTTVVSPTPETAPPPSPSTTTTTGPPKPTPPIGTPEASPTTGKTTAPPPSPSTTTTTGPPKPTPPIGTPEASPTTGRTTVVSPTPETAPPPSPSTTTTTGPPKPTPPIGTPEASPTTGRTTVVSPTPETAPPPSPSTTTTTGPPKPTPPIGTPEASPTTGRTTAPLPSPSTTTTTGPPKPTPPIGTPEASPTTGRTTVVSPTPETAPPPSPSTTTTTGPPKPTPPIGTPEASPTTGRTTVVSPTPETAPPPSPSTTTTTGPPKPTPPIGTPEASPTTGRTTAPLPSPSTTTTTGPPKPTPPIGTPEASPTTGRTTVVSPTPETAPPPSPSTTTTTGPPKPTPPIGTPEASPTTGRTTAPPPSPSTTTTTGPPKPTPPIGTPEASPTTGRTTVVSPTPETAPPPSPSTTTTTGPPKPTPPIGTPEASPTTGRTTAPPPSPSTTTTTGPPKPTPPIGTPEASPTTGITTVVSPTPETAPPPSPSTTTTTGPPKPTPPIGTPEASPTTGRTTVVSPTPETAPPPSPSTTTTTGPPKPTPPIGTPEASPTTGRTTAPPPSPSTTTTTGPPKPTPPIGTPEASPTTGRTTAPLPSPSTTTTTGPPKPTLPIGTPEASPTTGRTTAPPPSPSTTTTTTTGPPKPTPPIGTPEASPTTGRTTVVSPTPETAPPPSPSTTTTTGPPKPTPPIGTPEASPTTGRTTAPPPSPSTTTTTTTGPPKPTPPIGTPEASPTTGRTTAPLPSPSTTTTTGPPKPTLPIGTPEASPTTGRTTAPPPSPSTTTTTGPPKPTPPIGTPEASPTTGRTTAPLPSPSTTTTTGPPKPTPPIGTPEVSPTAGRTTVVSPTPETAPPPSPSTTTTTGPPKPTPPIGTPEASPTTGRTTVVRPTPETAPPPNPSTTTTTGPPKPTPPIGTPEASPTTGRTTVVRPTPETAPPPSPSTTTTTGPPKPTPPIGTPEASPTTGRTTVVSPTPETAPPPSPSTTTTTGPPKPTPPIGTPEASPTTGRTTVVSPTPETAPPPSPSTTTTTGPSTPTTPTTPIRTPEPTTPCVCTVNGTQYKPGDIIYDKHNIGSGICLTMICSAICEIQNSTAPCPTPTPVPTPTPTPTVTPDCPEWDKVQNETFWICNCTLARCIEDNIIEIIPYECPPLETLTCANGKKPVLVWDENLCCQKYACDCYCEGWGDPHYVTFDGLSYSHQGNCTYVLMEEIHPVFDFKIYVDNVKCDPREDVSCPRSVIISHKSDVITLKNNNLMGPAKLEAQKDGTTLKLPHAKNGIRVSGSGLKLIYEIPKLQIVVTFGIVGFTVNLPFQLFGNNTQGHCGTCNNNPHDDCRLPDGRLVDSCAVMADFWPAQDVYRPDCPVPDVVPTGMPLPLPSLRPCGEHPVCDLIKSDLFAECHPHISPDRFFDGCVFDSCHMVNPVVQCTSLQIYADACIQVDVCVNWRNHTTLCASDCPADKVYKPCGPAEQPTCDESLSGPGMNVVTEGCFCPEGTKLFSKDSSVCVDKCGCLDPDGKAREFDERFEHNCQDCVCEESTKAISCKSKQCPPPSITPCAQPGFVLVNTTDPSNPCCTLLTCRCDSSLCPTPNKRCSAGYEPVLMLTEGKCCQEIGCEPKPVCLHKQLEYKPGESVPVIPCQDCKCSEEKDPKSPWLEVKCHMMNCNEDCEPGYEYQTDDYDYDACCGECIQTHCALNVSGTVQLLEPGSTWFPHDSKCVAYSCTKVGDKFIAFKSDIQCPPFKESNCQPGTIQTLSNGCCKVCEQVSTGCQVETMLKTITYQGCQSQEEVEISHCEGSCNAFSKYSELEASMKHTCTCCRESRTSNRTVSLTCLDGSKVPHTYMHVEECQCSAKLCDDSSPWAPRRTGTGSFGRVTPRRRISTGGQSPIVKRSLSDRGG
ncbi:mucin-2-like isoform X2 [Clupea harengus]|uniref:Mucin-2-like isoform X2 n=1 Tax=Clupea harengus TaxID=7950 RepID=A0A8M1KFV1_CLUHA|nr:mucin-2-like isoform X2 [Clupea harengus]